MGDMILIIIIAVAGLLLLISFIVIKSRNDNIEYIEEASESSDEQEEIPEREDEPEEAALDSTDSGEVDNEVTSEDKAESVTKAKAAAPVTDDEVAADDEDKESDAEDYDDDDTENSKVKAMSEFDKSLIQFLESSGYDIENYMVSPASLRAVIAMAVAGAGSSTRKELLAAAGFEDEKQMNLWYKGLINAPDTSSGLLTFKLLNSVWHNRKMPGNISEKYKKYVKAFFGAEAKDVVPDKITGEVNSWVKEGTNGLIPKISNDLSEKDIMLINTLYLKATWVKTFDEYLTEEGDFKAFDECNIKKVFMEKTDTFKFYEDDSVKLVVLPMNGRVEAIFAIGDITGIQDKLEQASTEHVHIKLPRFDTETSLNQGELIKFLKKRGVVSAFSKNADFTAMTMDKGFYISDVIQKTKITTDENGLEAAAATAMAVLGAAPLEDEVIPKEFIANEPFKYLITTSGKNKEILFYGQIVE